MKEKLPGSVKDKKQPGDTIISKQNNDTAAHYSTASVKKLFNESKAPEFLLIISLK